MAGGGQHQYVGGIYADLELRTDQFKKELQAARAGLTDVEQQIKNLGNTPIPASLTSEQTRWKQAVHDTSTEYAQMAASFRAVKALGIGALGTTKISDHAALKAYIEALRTGATEAQAFAVGQAAAVAAIDKVAAASEKAGSKQRKLGISSWEAGNGMAALDASARRSSYRMFAFAYALDDVQYGIKGIANNIPMLLAPLGPWGAGLSIVAAAAVLVVNNWEEINRILGTTPVKSLTDQMLEMAAATRNASAATKELANAKKESAQIDSLYEQKGKEETARSGAIKGGIGDDFGILVQKGAEALGPLREATDQEKQKVKWAELNLKLAEKSGLATEMELQFARDRVDEAKRGVNETIIAERKLSSERRANKAMEGDLPELRNQIAMLRRRKGDNQAQRLADTLEAQTPEAIDEAAYVAADEKENARRAAITAAKKKAAAERAAEKQKAADEKLEEDFANRFAKGAVGTQMMKGRNVSAEDLMDKMTAAGVDPMVAAAMSGNVHKLTKSKVADLVGQRSMEKDISASAARDEIVGERGKKAMMEKERDRREAFEIQQTWKRETVSAAAEQFPEMKKLAARSIENKMLRGQNFKEASEGTADDTFSFLMGQGKTRDEAIVIAREVQKDAAGGVRERIMNNLVNEQNGGRSREQRHSQVIAAADFGRSVQESIGKEDIPKKSLVQLQRMNLLMEKFLANADQADLAQLQAVFE